MNHYVRAALLALLILGSLGLHALTATEPLWLDEAISARQATGSIADTVSRVVYDVHTPLYHVLLNKWTDITGTNAWQIRSLSIIFHALSIYALYRLGQDFYTESTAWISAALLAITEATVHYGQEARPYSLLILLSILSTYTYLSYRDNKKKTALTAHTAINAALLYTHVFGALILAAQALNEVIDWYNTKANKTNMVMSWATTLVLFSPWLPILYDQVRTSALTWLTTPTLTSITDAYIVILGTPITVLLVLAVLIASNHTTNRFLTLWAFLPPLILLTVSYTVGPMWHHRYILLTIPVLYLLIGNHLDSYTTTWKTAIITALVILALTTHFYPDNLERDEWDNVANELNATNQTIIVHPVSHIEPLTRLTLPECVTDDIYQCTAQKGLTGPAFGECCSPQTPLLGTNKTLSDIDNPVLIRVTQIRGLDDITKTYNDTKLSSTHQRAISVYK